jgi:predicted PurR-regulated permease PerM
MVYGSQGQKKLSFTFLLLLTLGALYLSFLIARPFLSAIILAALLAVATYPLFTFLLRYVRKRSAAALLATLVILLGLILPTIFVVNTIADEMKALYGWLNEQASDGSGWEGLLTRFTNPPARWIEQKTGISRQEVRRAALGRLQDVSTSLLNWAKSLAVNITGTVVDTFIMLLTLFYCKRPTNPSCRAWSMPARLAAWHYDEARKRSGRLSSSTRQADCRSGSSRSRPESS